MTYTQTTLYPNLRLSLSPEFGHLSDSDLEAAFESAFGEGVSPAEYEEFFGGLGRAISSAARDVGHFAQKAAPAVANIGSGALQGAMTGSALGPYGMLAGAVAGGVGSGLSQYGGGSARQVGNVMNSALGAAGMLTGRGAAGSGMASLLGGLAGGRGGGGGGLGAGAAGQLLGVLQRPETLRALQAMAGGGGRGVPIGRGGMAVPASTFASLIGALAREAEAESIGAGDGEDEPGSLPAWQAGQLLQLLASVPPTAPPQRVWRAAEAEGSGAEDYGAEGYGAEDYGDAEEAFIFEAAESFQGDLMPMWGR